MLKDNIYTIPVLERLRKDSECPFCLMLEELDSEAVTYTLSPAYMEEHIRTETNKKGFCASHYRKMFETGNRLGLALMLSTHLKKARADLEPLLNEAPEKGRGFLGIFSKQSKEPAQNDACSYLDELVCSCYICDRVNDTFLRYADTFFLLFSKSPEVTELIRNGKGFCLSHFSLLLKMGETKLNSADFVNFKNLVTKKQTENLARIQEDIDHFVNKFDYNYQDAPWKNSKDAVPRTILKISSQNVLADEKNKDTAI